MENSSNPWGMSQGERADWTQGVEGIEIVEGGDPLEAEYLYWVGCAGSFDDKNKKVTQSMAKLVRAPTSTSPSSARPRPAPAIPPDAPATSTCSRCSQPRTSRLSTRWA